MRLMLLTLALMAPLGLGACDVSDAAHGSSSGVCRLGGQTYREGQAMPSPDGCNTCTCIDGEPRGCTELYCEPAPVHPPRGS